MNFQQNLKKQAELEAAKKAEIAAKKQAELLASTPIPFVGPENSFYFLGSKTMKDDKKRSYLVSVTKSGNLTAYVTQDFDGTEIPIYENLIPLIIKRKSVNSIPSAVEKLGLDSVLAKMESKEFRTIETGYLESIKLPSLKQLMSLKLNDTEVSKLTELVESYKRVNARNSAVFAAHVRALIKSRSAK